VPTRDQDCVRFLRWALPRLGYRWPGYRKVRRQVCRRVRRRLEALGLADLDAYARLLAKDPDEWPRLDDCCHVTISRFYRDRQLWEVLGRDVLPALYAQAAASDPPRIRVWSAGCGAGEEPYTMAMLLRLGPKPLPAGVDSEIVGTDLDRHQLERARRAAYPESSLRDLPAAWRRRAFAADAGGAQRLLEPHAEATRFLLQDLRGEAPAGPFDLVLCRNLAFTYFDSDTQARCLARLLANLGPSGWLAIGCHETLPAGGPTLLRHPSGLPLFARPLEGPFLARIQGEAKVSGVRIGRK